MPVLFERDHQAYRLGAAGRNARGQGDEFGGEVLALHRTGAAVAKLLQLRRRGHGKGECRKQREKEPFYADR